MYYNIKIKSNGSEFSLDSNNKEITQREMDIYFAHIFDVSEDFKSQIKKVEINNTNVKSIEEIENFTKNYSAQQPQVEIQQIIQQPTQIPTQASQQTQTQLYYQQPSEIPTQTLTQVPTQAPRQILPEIKITSEPIQIQPQRIVVEQSNSVQNMQQPLPRVSLQNSTQPVIQNYTPSQAPTQAPIQPQNNVLNMQTAQINHQPTQAEIENLLNNYIENSLEPITPNQKNPLQETPTLQSYFDSITMPSEEITEAYEHQKEILEIKFDNIPNFKNQENGYGYGEISTKNIEVELQEIEELDSIQPISYTQNQEEIQEQPSFNEIVIEQTVPTYSYEEIQIEQTIPQPIYTEPKILVKSEIQTTEEAPAIQNDIDELISLAQNRLDSFDMNASSPKPQISIKPTQEVDQTYETIDFDLSNSKFANYNSYKETLEQEKEQHNVNNQAKINQIFSNKQQQITKTEYAQKQNSQPQNIQDVFQEEYEMDDTPAEVDIKNESIINLGNIDMEFEEEIQGVTQAELAKGEYREYSQEERQQILSTPELVAPTINIPTIQTPVMSEISEPAVQPTQISQITQVVQQTQQPIQELPTQVVQVQNIPQNTQGSYTQDFKLYLNEFNCDTQSEQFLICAFYIKNILKQENFTMKSINSKLFQATGAIADLGILDDLVSKAYIRVISTPEAKKYCITPDGEGYFISRFQG